jgi:energy-converting hydrogenase Eha subunit F
MQKEQWKIFCVGTQWTYECSTEGRFRRLGKTGYCYLKPYFRNCIEGSRHTNRKHSLIIKISPNGGHNKPKEINCKNILAKMFIRPLNRGEVVITKNGDNQDIKVSNLFITTQQNLGKITGYKTCLSKRVCRTDKTGYKYYYRSARQCGIELGISYQTVLDYCWNKVKRPKYDLKWDIKELI